MTGHRTRGSVEERSPILAGVFSALLPGAGQWYAGRPARGLVIAAPLALSLVMIVIGSFLGVIGPRSILVWAVQPDLLRLSLIVSLVILVWHAAAVIDAYVIAGGRWLSSRLAPVVIAGLLLVVAIPHVATAAYTVRGIGVLEEVFVAEEPPTPGVVTMQAPDREALAPDPVSIWDDPVGFEFERSTRNLLFRRGVGDPEAIAAWADILAPPTLDAPFLPFEERIGAERLTILLVGADEGPGREGLRTDSMIVATVDVATGDAALFGVPRNFKRVPLPARFRSSFVELQKRAIEREAIDEDEDGYPDDWIDEDGDGIPDEPEFVPCGCFPEMLNRVHQYTRDWTRSYPDTPDPGLAALRDTVAFLIDLPIDYYFMVNMAGFVDIIDTIGGVDVMVKDTFHVAVSAPSEDSPKARVDVEPGMNHLNGLEALAYSRWRIGSSDYARMQRQRCLIRAATDQADPLTLIRSFHTLADVVERSVVTDLPLSLLPDLVDIVGRIDLDRIATVGLVPPTYNDGRAPGGYPIPNVSRIRWKVGEVIEGGVAEQSGTGESECGV
ncbi:MAG: LCP family protein [Actinomycetota bacterium]|nr:LCP family protein [Actinomycetota bacterium]